MMLYFWRSVYMYQRKLDAEAKTNTLYFKAGKKIQCQLISVV